MFSQFNSMCAMTDRLVKTLLLLSFHNSLYVTVCIFHSMNSVYYTVALLSITYSDIFVNGNSMCK